MAKLKKGSKVVCQPCGREVIVSTAGISNSTIWCCGKPMKSKTKVGLKKKTAKKS